MTDGTRSCDLCDLASTEVFRALGDANRIAIVNDLVNCCGGSKTVSEVAAGLPLDLSVVSRYLRQLRDVGLLSADRRGKQVYYRVRYGEFVRYLRTLADAIESCCPSEDLCLTQGNGRTLITEKPTANKGGTP